MRNDVETYQKNLVYEPLQQPWVRPVLLAASVLMIAGAVLFICLARWGYGTVRFDGISGGNNVYVNGHKVMVDTLTLRPGTYQLAITSPMIDPYVSTFQVSLFQQTTVPKPTLIPRDASAIAGSLIGAIPGTSIPPTLASPQWFEKNTWVVGKLEPTPDVIVMHYDAAQKQWSVVFLSNSSSYPNDLTSLPTAVAAYVQSLLVEAT